MQKRQIKAYSNEKEYEDSKKLLNGSAEQYVLAYDHAWTNLIKGNGFSQAVKLIMLRFAANQIGIVMHWSNDNQENQQYIDQYRKVLIMTQNFKALSNFDEVLMDSPSRLSEFAFHSLLEISQRPNPEDEKTARFEALLRKLFFRCPISTIHGMVEISTVLAT